MNIEELSKAQLILLTILVNFITSVATGILTVSLLDEAPPIITQTVNRVVEHTIETVVQATPAKIIQAPVPAPAPSNQDLVTAAISANASRTVLLYPLSTGTSSPAIAIGTYLAKSRTVITATLESLPKEALIVFPNGAHVPASLTKEESGISVYGFDDKANLPKTVSPALVQSSELRLGATALALTADGSAATGIVSRVSEKGVQTTLPDIGTGSSAVNLSGNIIGIAAGGTAGLLIPANTIAEVLAATPVTATQ